MSFTLTWLAIKSYYERQIFIKYKVWVQMNVKNTDLPLSAAPLLALEATNAEGEATKPPNTWSI